MILCTGALSTDVHPAYNINMEDAHLLITYPRDSGCRLVQRTSADGIGLENNDV